MGLFINDSPPSQQQQVQDALLSAMDDDFNDLLNKYNAKMGLVWGGTCGIGTAPQGGMTVQEIFAAAGTNGAKMVSVASDIRDLINKYAPGTLQTTTPLPLTVNSDNTVTVG